MLYHVIDFFIVSLTQFIKGSKVIIMEQMQFILEQFFAATAIPLRVLDSAGEQCCAAMGYQPTADPLNASDLKGVLLRKAAAIPDPLIKITGDFCAYGVLRDGEGRSIIIGPIMLRSMSSEEIQEFAFLHRVSPLELIVEPASLLKIASAISLLHFLLTGEQLPPSSVQIEDTSKSTVSPLRDEELQAYMLQSVESDIQHTSAQTELAYLQQIREGNVEAINVRVMPNFDLNSVGVMAKRSIKHFEYMICTSIALATRAAIEGGLDQVKAFSMSDLYLQRLELCQSIDEIIKVQIDMKLAFARQVRKARETRSAKSYVEKCKVYVANHLNKAVELDDIAGALGVNKAYLARKFKAETGMGVMQYLRTRRIEAAAKMLKYSDEPISTIADYFCFASQSHFGSIFRDIMKVTPHQFRDSESIV